MPLDPFSIACDKARKLVDVYSFLMIMSEKGGIVTRIPTLAIHPECGLR